MHRGRPDEEIIEIPRNREIEVPHFLRGADRKSLAYEMQKSYRRLNDQFYRVGIFPSKDPNPLKRRSKAILMARKDIRIREVGAAGVSNNTI